MSKRMPSTKNPQRAAEPDDHSPPASPRELVSTVALWALLNVAGLALGASHWRLGARNSVATDALALSIVGMIQIGFAAILLPLVLRNLASALALVAINWPMLALAAVLSRPPLGELLSTGMMTTFWIVGLALWSVTLRTDWQRAIISSIATLASVGGVVVWYLFADFHGPAIPWTTRAAAFGPLVGLLSIKQQAGASAFILPLIALTTGAASWAFQLAMARRHRKSAPV